MSYATLSAILKGKWLIDPKEAQYRLPIVANIIKGNTEFECEPNKISISVYDNSKKLSSTLVIEDNWDLNKALEKDKFTEGSTVVIPVTGALMKADQECGPVGMMTLAAITNRISAIDKVSTIAFEFDSPGGMVDGTQTFAQAIKNSPKKTIGYVNDGMACSAAYWLISSCDEVYATQKTDVFGSIGVYIQLADFKSYYEKLGLPIHEIYSNKSSEKNKDYADALKGDYKTIQNDLDFIATEFINAVKANRPNLNLSKGDPFKGATYYAEQAMEIGLIDGIKSINEIFTTNMSGNQNNAGGANAQENAAEVEEEVVEVVITAENTSEFINALDEAGVVAVNEKLVNHKLVANTANVISDAELAAFNDYKANVASFNTWKAKSDVSHTAEGDKDDKFLNSATGADALISAEMEYVNQKYGI